VQRLVTETKLHLPSIVETFRFHDRNIYIKRDDLVDKDLSGNKFRKLYFLLQTSSSSYKRIISYGGNQSNAMASIAALCKRKGWEFVYISKTFSHVLKVEPTGNLLSALNDGMNLMEVSHEEYRDVIGSLHSATPDTRVGKHAGDLLLAQGGADTGAKEGIAVLAEEIAQWQKEQRIKNLTLVTPSGTGTTAYFLARSLPKVDVLTTPLIGTSHYLKEQMNFLGSIPNNLSIIDTTKKFHFGKPYREFYANYQALLLQNIEIDLLYAPKTLLMLSEEMKKINGDILYVHSGGVLGNSSMLARYKHKGLTTLI